MESERARSSAHAAARRRILSPAPAEPARPVRAWDHSAALHRKVLHQGGAGDTVGRAHFLSVFTGALLAALILISGSAGETFAADSAGPHSVSLPPVATFSFVAQDTAAGISGVIVASKFFAVGSAVPWGRGDVGAVATQAFCNTTFGPAGLDLLAAGATPEQALEVLLQNDPGRESRQVGIVDAAGRSATFTGTECMAWAGGRAGPGYAAQGNILTGPEVVDRMVDAFLGSAGQYLGDRLLLALEAGEAAGGDSRGRQSAALLLVATGKGYGGFNDVLCDIRVDDHPDPFAELRRVYEVWLPNQLITEGYRLVEEGRFDEAIERGERAAELDPDSGSPFYHLACYYSRAGRAEKAFHYLGWAVRLDPSLSGQAGTDPDLEPLRTQPEWETAMGR